MKLQRDTFEVIKSNDLPTTADFGTKNPAIIFDILCHKLYENPLKILVQEYMCNARDSHREAGFLDKPITVVLPTQIVPSLKIIDEGVGISPDRMYNVFIYLGESTKNTDNLQTGGFGIGAKVGWAYSDSFTVITVYNNIKYTYLAYLGNAGIGQLDLLNKEENCGLPNGTTIEIAIKKEDFKEVYNYVFITSHFWDVRPVIKNAEMLDVSYNENYKLIKFDDIGILDTQTTELYNNYFDTKYTAVHAVVDGIIYFNIDKKVDGLLDKFDIPYKTSMYIFFKVGELDLAVNRENLQYTKNTIAVINQKIESGYNVIISDLSKSVDSNNTVIDIINTLPSLHDTFKFINRYDFIFKGVNFTIAKTKKRIDNLQLIYDFGEDASLIQYHLQKSDQVLKTIKYSESSKLSIIDIKNNIIFNDKFVCGVPRNVLKSFINENENNIDDIWYINPRVVSEDFYKKHGNLLVLFDNFIKLTDIKPRAIRQKTNGIVCYTYNHRHSSKISKSYNDLIKLNKTLLFVSLNDTPIGKHTINPDLFNTGIDAYNGMYKTNYMLVGASKTAEKKLRALGLWRDFHEWYEAFSDRVYYNASRKFLFTLHLSDMKKYLSELNERLNNTDIVDPAFNKYFENVKSIDMLIRKYEARVGKEYKQKQHVQYNKFILFKFVLRMRFKNSTDHPDFDIVKAFFDRKNKNIKKTIEYINTEYPLLDHLNYYSIRSNTTNYWEIINYINNKFKIKTGQLVPKI